ncbi:MAG: HD domain-containing protein [Actinomycetota bacterium]
MDRGAADAPQEPAARLGPRFAEALELANRLHGAQTRKGGTVPYVSHLLAVTALVLEAGGDEDEAIAALLHDAIEDQGDQVTIGELEERFGPRVRAIVEGCSDTELPGAGEIGERGPANSLRRKQLYLRHLDDVGDESVLRVSLADKLHNARTILADRRASDDGVFGRFNVGKWGTLWYYRGLARFYAARFPPGGPPALTGQAAELARVVGELRDLAGGPTDAEIDLGAGGLRGDA